MTQPLVFAVDTETTGLPEHPEARVFEVAISAWSVADDVEVYSDSFLLRPDVLTDEGLAVARDICGVDPDLILNAPSQGEAKAWWREQLVQLERLSPGFTLDAWNLPFDRTFIRRTLLDVEDLPEAWQGWEAPVVYPNPQDPSPWGVCWMRIFSDLQRPFFGTFTDQAGIRHKRPASLRRAATMLQIAQVDAHRALDDARVCAQVGAKIVRGDVAQAEIPKTGVIRLR